MLPLCLDDDEMEVLNEKRPQRSGFSATAGISGPKVGSSIQFKLSCNESIILISERVVMFQPGN